MVAAVGKKKAKSSTTSKSKVASKTVSKTKKAPSVAKPSKSKVSKAPVRAGVTKSAPANKAKKSQVKPKLERAKVPANKPATKTAKATKITKDTKSLTKDTKPAKFSRGLTKVSLKSKPNLTIKTAVGKIAAVVKATPVGKGVVALNRGVIAKSSPVKKPKKDRVEVVTENKKLANIEVSFDMAMAGANDTDDTREPVVKTKANIIKRKSDSNGPIAPYDTSNGESYMSNSQLDHFRQLLEKWRRDLMEEVDHTITEMKESTNLADPNDRATQEETFGLELRTRDRERKLLKKIEEALQQIEDQEYGYCETCGVEIGVRRLEARPTATLCIDCKTLAEIREKRA